MAHHHRPGVLDVTGAGLVLVETASGVSAEQVAAATAAPLVHRTVDCGS
ncbi:hypothetical protein [Streptomyces finlayi]|nr:hypothetical protein [Streptomyces finlayi]